MPSHLDPSVKEGESLDNVDSIVSNDNAGSVTNIRQVLLGPEWYPFASVQLPWLSTPSPFAQR